MTLTFCLTACAKPSSKQDVKKELNSSVQFQLHSKPLNSNFTIHINVPENYRKEKKYPIIYILSSGLIFDRASQHFLLTEKDKLFQSPIIVGINNDSISQSKEKFNTHLLPIGKSNKVNNAELFLNFLTNKIIPSVEKKYSVNTSARSLYGHSKGALFTLYSYVKAPELFTHFIASSPDLTWQNEWFVKNLSSKDAQITPYLYISFGGKERQAINVLENYLSDRKIKFDKNNLSYRVFREFGNKSVIPVSQAYAFHWLATKK